MINREGEERDLFSIVKRGKVTPRRLALPWQPPAYVKPTNTVSIPAQPAVDHRVLIPEGATWRYAFDPLPQGRAWTEPGFDDASWLSGPAGFGFGEGNFRTPLAGMRGKHAILCARRSFEIEQADRVTELGLWIDYDDAFVAYVNGQELARVGVGRSSGRNAQKIAERSEKKTGRQYVALKHAHRYLKDGTNVLAIEVHNASVDSSDFRLDPILLLED